MTDRSGSGPIDLAVLQAIDACAAPGPGKHVTCPDVLPLIEERTGLGPRYAYDVLLDLARPWVIAVPTITADGDIGDRDFPASGPRHVGCRASQAGQAVLDAEARRIAPVPAGLINGTAYRGGTQPPLEPARVIAALRHLLKNPRAADIDLLAIAGPPFSVTGCTVTGDVDALAAGQDIMLGQTGRITLTGNPVPEPAPVPASVAGGAGPASAAWMSSGPRRGDLARAQLVIESLPPGASPSAVGRDLAQRARNWASTASDGRRPTNALPIADLADVSTSAVPIRIAITLVPGADPVKAREQLAAVDGVTIQEPAAYPGPLAALLRNWAERHGGEDIAASLTRFEDAIRRDGQ